MPLKNKSFLEPIQKPNFKKKELPACFTNRLSELNTIKAFPQYIPNTRTPALRPIPKINPRYMARLNDTHDFEKEIQESEITKELEMEMDEERHRLKLKFDSEVVTERSTIPFGITPKSKLLTPVLKKNNSGILSSFLSENSLCKNGNLNIIESTYNFGISPDIFQYLKQHSKSVTKNDYYHYSSESPSSGNLNINYQYHINKSQIPLLSSLSIQNIHDQYSNTSRPILNPNKSLPMMSTKLDKNLNDTKKNKEILESYKNYIQNASKELINIHSLRHFPGINDSEEYKKTENVISNSTYKYICNVVQNRSEENNNNNKNNPIKHHKKKGALKSFIHSDHHSNSELDNNYWINSIMNGFKDEQLIQDLTHTERVDSKTPIYRQRYPANIQQMHIDVKKKSKEEKKIKYERLINDMNNSIISRSNNNLLIDLSSSINNNSNNNNIPNNSSIPKDNVSKKKLFRVKYPYLTISLIHFSSLLKSDQSRQISTYNFEKNDFIEEENIIPLSNFLKTSLSNYQGPIPKRGTKMFYNMYSIFIQGLKSQDKNIRFESMNGIAKLDCIEMIPQVEKIWFNSLLNQVIIEGTNDDKWTICTMLARHGIQTPQVIDYLKSILGDTDPGKRKYVIYLLSRISDKNVNCLVKSIIYDKIKDANWRVRLDCIKILRKLLKRMLKYIPENELYVDIDKEMINDNNNDLNDQYNDDDINKLINNEKIRNNNSKNDKYKGSEISVKENEANIINQALQIVMNIMWYDWKLDVRNTASKLLMKIGKGKPIYSWIIQMISSDNPMKKLNGLKCIGCLNIMTNDAIEPFLKCFDDVFSSIRVEACKVAYILELNYPPLIQKLANCFDDNSWEVRAFAIKAISRSKCKSDLINNTILWNLVHETNHRVLFETIKAVKKLNLVNESQKIKEALLLLTEDKNENIAELAKRILYDNGILDEKNKKIEYTSFENIVKVKPQKEINILYNTRPPFNFACDGLDMIKHEVNLLTMKDYITSEIMEQEKKYKNYSRIDGENKYIYEDIMKKPSIPIEYSSKRY
ncbi:ARM repeat-containing protein [Neocallimastix californiae]|uniref:ARM repeat-containing protein n=1 Tax=Neocallimastix californiae TaxID=1754190 RepID=A0A1Y2CMZ2_9FUNG|nr:ARM repeat-containing protein [Neocallimastix californiae]|eukprot:ORY48399.1 ARM repeat-containing protein [Neocallimastix californiae]